MCPTAISHRPAGNHDQCQHGISSALSHSKRYKYAPVKSNVHHDGLSLPRSRSIRPRRGESRVVVIRARNRTDLYGQVQTRQSERAFKVPYEKRSKPWLTSGQFDTTHEASATVETSVSGNSKLRVRVPPRTSTGEHFSVYSFGRGAENKYLPAGVDALDLYWLINVHTNSRSA